jgi:hypothetical protein
MSEIQNKYIEVVYKALSPSRRTKIFSVVNKQSGIELGEIRWFGHWRQYVFFPSGQIALSSGCMTDIAAFCTSETKQQRDSLTR